MTRKTSRTARRIGKGAAAAALAIAAALTGSAAHGALFPTVTASGSVSAGTLSVEVSNLRDMTLTNETSSIATPITVTNTSNSASTQKARVALQLTTGAVPASLGVTAARGIEIADVSECPADRELGLLGSMYLYFPTGGTLTADLAPGESQSYCVMFLGTTLALNVPSGSWSTSFNALGTISLGTLTATHQSSSTFSTFARYPLYTESRNSWFQMKPVGQDLCMEVTGGANAPLGSGLRTAACQPGNDLANSNQWFTPHAPYQERTYIRVRSNPTATIRPNGTAIQLLANPGANTQEWAVQRIGATDTYQFVNMPRGLCVTAVPGGGPLTLASCNDTDAQRFTFTPVNTAPPSSLLRDGSETGPTDADAEDAAEAPTETEEVSASSESVLDTLAPGAEAVTARNAHKLTAGTR